jgi:hypothetical protein
MTLDPGAPTQPVPVVGATTSLPVSVEAASTPEGRSTRTIAVFGLIVLAVLDLASLVAITAFVDKTPDAATSDTLRLVLVGCVTAIAGLVQKD